LLLSQRFVSCGAATDDVKDHLRLGAQVGTTGYRSDKLRNQLALGGGLGASLTATGREAGSLEQWSRAPASS